MNKKEYFDKFGRRIVGFFKGKNGSSRPIIENVGNKSYKLPQKVLSNLQKGKDYRYYLIDINPKDFLELTTNNHIMELIRDVDMTLDLSKVNDSLMYLEYDANIGQIISHNGRNRMYSFNKAGYNNVQTILKVKNGSKTGKYNYFKLRGQMNKEKSLVINNPKELE